MGDWAVTTHWSPTRPQLPVARDFIDERWAARLGRVGQALWQLETVQKYGFYAGPDDPQVVGVQAGYDYLRAPSSGPFVAGWNYVLGSEPRWLEEAATLIEGARVLALAPSASRFLLALPNVQRCDRARAAWWMHESQLDPDPMVRVVEALGACRRGLEASQLVIGLHTHDFGYVHTGSLQFPSGRNGTAAIELQLTGCFNPLSDDHVSGPYAGSIYTQRAPSVALPTLAWPFSPD